MTHKQELVELNYGLVEWITNNYRSKDRMIIISGFHTVGIQAKTKIGGIMQISKSMIKISDFTEVLQLWDVEFELDVFTWTKN